MAGAPCRMLAVGETGPGSSWGVGAPGGRDRQRLQGLGRHHRAVCRRPPPRPPELHPSLRPGPLRARAGVLLGPEADRSGQERHGHRWGLWGRGVHLPRDVAAPALGPCVRTRDGRAPSSPSFRPGRSLKPGAVSLATVPDAPPGGAVLLDARSTGRPRRGGPRRIRSRRRVMNGPRKGAGDGRIRGKRGSRNVSAGSIGPCRRRRVHRGLRDRECRLHRWMRLTAGGNSSILPRLRSL